jgi:preprotein translocase subunit SecG
MYEIILLVHVVIAIALVVLILLQQGRGASIGASFGSGASNTVFGAQGSGAFLIKVTAGLGFAFFLTSLVLGYIAAQTVKQGAVLPSEPAVTSPVGANKLQGAQKPATSPSKKQQ